MNLLWEAQLYRSMDWAVYPAHGISPDGICTCGKDNCPCPGKHPIGSWLRYQNQLPTNDEVNLWFSSLDCNVGCITGLVSGIVVVDIDGEVGINSARMLDLKPTLTARTGGGGYHLFYSTTVNIPSRVKAYDGIDIRGDGGYVVLSPSLHRSGRLYEWLEPREPEPFDPEPFARALSSNTDTYGWHEEILDGVSEGERNISAARLAGRYFGLGLSPYEVWVLMSDWNTRNEPPLGSTELRRTVEAIRRKHEETTIPIQIKTLTQIQKLLGNRSIT